MADEKTPPALKDAPPPRKRQEQAESQPPIRGLLAWGLILAMTLLMVHLYMTRQDTYKEVSYSEFRDLVNPGHKIDKCQLTREVSGVEYVTAELLPETEKIGTEKPGVEKPAAEKPAPHPQKIKVYVRAGDKLEEFLDKNGVKLEYVNQNPYMWQIVSSVLPVVIVFGLLYFLFVRQIKAAGTGALNFGKSRARMLTRDKNRVTFADVAGIDEAKEEVQEIIEFLKDPKKFQKLGGRIPKGVLLMGPPGTGKTLLAKAIAGEADVPFFSISGSDFVEMFVGVGASRVRDMFEQGKKSAPCIIFIDEIDAVGRSRFSGIGGGHDEREQTLNALLVQMDGFETQEGVIILAATNRPDVLDNALLRPGRFDRQIVIDLPMIEGREAILKIHSRGIKLAEGVDLRRIARGTPGFSGADLQNLMNEAALLGAREGKSAVDIKHLEEARDKVRWGRERRSRVLDEKEKKITAYHEAGHALIMELDEESEPLHKITIIPRGVAYLGATMQLPEKDRHMEGRTKLLGLLTGMMGGRVAEELVFTDITSGASADLKEATRVARHMVCDWGMSERMGPQTFGENQDLMFLGRDITRARDYSEDTARQIDGEVNSLLRDAHTRATDLIRTHRDKLDMIAALLLERETLDGRDVQEIVENGRLLSEEERDKIDRAAEQETKAAAASNGQTPPPLVIT